METELCYILQHFAGRKSVPQFYDIPSDHVSLMLGGVTLFLGIINVRNTRKRPTLQYNIWRDFFSAERWKNLKYSIAFSSFHVCQN